MHFPTHPILELWRYADLPVQIRTTSSKPFLLVNFRLADD
jgi:hypothetical protein